MDEFITNKCITERSCVANDHDIWLCKDKKTDGNFFVHVMNGYKLYITFFNHRHQKKIRTSSVIAALKGISKKIKEEGVIPEIRISNKNKALIGMCYKAGFTKKHGVKDVYEYSK